MKTLLLATIATLSLAATAQAQTSRESNINGARLGNLCLSQNTAMIQGCEAYIDAVADSAGVYQNLRPADGQKGAALPAYICVPAQITGVQLRQGYVQWLRQHQDQGRRIAAGAVLTSLLDTYPCSGAPRG